MGISEVHSENVSPVIVGRIESIHRRKSLVDQGIGVLAPDPAILAQICRVLIVPVVLGAVRCRIAVSLRGSKWLTATFNFYNLIGAFWMRLDMALGLQVLSD